MRRNTKKIVVAIAAIAALAAGGAAFTASNTVPNTTAGYGTSTVTGATVKSIHYTLNGTKTTITDADLVFDGDLTSPVLQNVEAGFEGDNLTACTVGAYDNVGDETPVTCTGYTQSTAASSAFHVAVHN
jgi:uncharacterized protein YdeI (BOF family)